MRHQSQLCDVEEERLIQVKRPRYSDNKPQESAALFLLLAHWHPQNPLRTSCTNAIEKAQEEPKVSYRTSTVIEGGDYVCCLEMSI